MKHLLPLMLDPAILLDREGNVVDANDDATVLFTRDVVGDHVSNLLAGDFGMTVQCRMSNHELDRRKVFMNEDGEILKPCGSTVHVELRMGLVLSDGGHYFVITLRDISARKKQEEIMFSAAYTDTLTGLPNRALMLDRLTQALKSSSRRNARNAVIFIDLDRFKNINDTHGHETGDAVLKTIATRLRDAVRQPDTIARMGGDEFVAILVDLASPEDAGIAAERIRAACCYPVEVQGKFFHLSASIGIAFSPDDSNDHETLMKYADTAMYYAKSQGKNQVQFFSSEMNVRAVRRMSIEAQLNSALYHDQFTLFYQPQVDMKTNEIIGLEALIRLDSDAGMMLPEGFIYIAEETGIITQIGEWALFAACRQIDQWRLAGMKSPRVAVNISCRQFTNDLPVIVQRALSKYRLPPHSLELEITESMVATDDALQIMRKLNSMGIDLSIDDFGTGYSNFPAMKKLPVKSIKIDKLFVDNILSDENDLAIIEAIMTISKRMGFNTIVEGIEDEAHLDVFRNMGCDAWQGYLMSRPLPAKEIEERFLIPLVGARSGCGLLPLLAVA